MRIGKVLLVVALALGFGAPAQAVVLGLDWGLGTSNIGIKYKGEGQHVWAGRLNAYLGGSLGNPLPPNDGTFIGSVFCVDLDHHISLPTEYEVTPQSASALTNGQRVAWAYQAYLSQTTTQSLAAALQLAIWDIVYDNGDGLSTGQFRYVNGLDAPAVAQASSFIAASSGRGGNATYYKANGPYGQSMIGPVPEPGSLILLGFGLAFSAAGLVLRKRSKTRLTD